LNPLIVSFSGIDGAGKSTQIQKLREYLASHGVAVKELAFWDHVVMFPALRAGFSRRVLQSDGRIGTPEQPAERRDKNTQSAPLWVGRSVLYLLDVLSLRRIFNKAKAENSGVVIFDRFIYDQLAALPLRTWWARAFSRLLLRIAPKPDLSYVLDADPEVARARKPEYPLEFMLVYRSAYLELRKMAPLQLIQPAEIEEVHQEIVDRFRDCVLQKELDPRAQQAIAA
jgi:thymidylate kinase